MLVRQRVRWQGNRLPWTIPSNVVLQNWKNTFRLPGPRIYHGILCSQCQHRNRVMNVEDARQICRDSVLFAYPVKDLMWRYLFTYCKGWLGACLAVFPMAYGHGFSSESITRPLFDETLRYLQLSKQIAWTMTHSFLFFNRRPGIFKRI